ncbi:UBN2 domain-containing protein [Cephalotus follicularis]|uniref:UBN2 domain-containing protein n=1 Tax=Cephalotus follicularis TaxID=3775 RepID=A0A1Q3C0X4_CEPFO|nr:UBN2 domain-containing protein [Cephalotus follicularis]
MWDRLEVTYEGINQVKDTKISMLVHEYELFQMHEDEDIKSMFTRFTNIINALQSLDKTFSNRHYKSDFPRLKKKEFIKKKKEMVATWDDSDESSSDEDTREQVAQLALMVFEEEKEEESEEVTYDELIIMCEKYNSKIASLKKKVRTLINENDELKTIDLTKEINSNDVEIDFLENEVAHLEEENKNLKVEVDALKKTLSKFSSSSEKLENLLGMQRCVFDKAGLGYEEMNNVKHYQNFFERKEMIEKNKVEMFLLKGKLQKLFVNIVVR